MTVYDLNFLIERYGNPVLMFQPHGEFSEDEKAYGDVPLRVAVFELKNQPSGFISCSTHHLERNDQWYINTAARFAIRELIRLLDIKNSTEIA